MRLWKLVRTLQEHPELFELSIPDIRSIPEGDFYIIKIIRYFPDKKHKERIYEAEFQYIDRDPDLSHAEIETIENKLKIKINELWK